MKHVKLNIWLVVIGAFVLILASALAMLCWNFTQTLDRLQAATESSAIGTASFLGQMIETDVQAANWGRVQSLLASYELAGIDFHFQVVLPDGSLVVDDQLGAPPSAAQANLPLASRSLAEKRPLGERLAPRVYQAAALVPGPDGQPLAVLVDTLDWSARYQQQQDVLLQQASVVVGFVLLVLLAGGVLIGALVVRPIRRLRLLAEHTAGSPSAPRKTMPRNSSTILLAPPFLTYELDRLGQAYNRMVQRLAEQRQALDRLNRQLETTVAVRTRQLAVRNRELQTLNRISSLALAASSMPEAYQAIVREISAATGFPVVAVERYDPVRQMMVFEALTGVDLPAGGPASAEQGPASPRQIPTAAGLRPALEVPVDQTPSGWVALSGEMLVEQDVLSRPDLLDDTLRSFGMRTLVCVPMKLEGQVLGVISLAHPESIDLDESLAGWMGTLANHIVALYVRLQAQASLSENEERSKLALEGTELGLWDWNIPNGKVLINERWASMLGYRLEELSPEMQAWSGLYHPEDYQLLKAALDEQLNGSQGPFELELRARTRSGGYSWVMMRGRLVASGPQGQPLRMVGTQRNIDEQKRASETLSQRDAILEAVSAAAESFLSSSSWQESLPEVMAHLGEATRTGRVYVFETLQDIDGTWLSRHYSEWLAPGVSSEMEQTGAHIHTFSADGFERWENLLSRGYTVSGVISSLPESERQYLESLGVRSLMAAPIFVGSRWWGYIGLDDCQEERQWSTAEQDALRLAAGVLGAAIQRQETEEMVRRLYETEREQRQISQVLREAGTALSATLNFDTILDRMMDELPRIAPFDAALALLVVGEQVYVARLRGYEAYDPGVLERVAGQSFDLAATPALRWMAENRQPLVIADTWVATGRLIRLLEHDPFRSWAAAPIAFQEKVVAFFCIEKEEPYFYRSDQVELLALFASQVALSLQNARLFTEALEAAEREHNLGQVTRAISSNLELSAILSNVVRLASELAGADAGALAIISADRNSITYPCLYNLPEELSLEPEPRGQSLAWEIARTGRSAVLEEYARHPLARKNWVEAGVHAILAVPVIAGESCLGGLALFSYSPEKHFTLRDLGLIESVGRQAGVAIQNARLFEDAQNRAHEAETLRQAVAEVTTARELKEVLDKILFHLGRVVPYDSSAVFLYEGDLQDHLRMMDGRNLENLEQLKAQVFSAENPLFLAIKQSARPVVLADVQLDPRFEGWGGTRDIHGWMGLLLRSRDKPIGYLTLDSRQVGAFSEQDAALVQAFADEVAIAIKNASLFEEVQKLAITDPLTGLFNRRQFFEAARKDLERSRRYNNPMSVVMLDIDHFKKVNDQYGHLAGDQVLICLSQRCLQALREVDVAARYGGEEFVFLLPETTLEGGMLVAERLRRCITDDLFNIGEQSIKISVSLGVAALDETCGDIQELLRRADLALYATKDAGRNRVSPYQLSMEQVRDE